jgi:aromatic ring-opening dioxygenase catalytic subunit (LigB family)
MASLAGVWAASHGPLMVRNWHAVPAAHKERITAAFQELGRRVAAARLDVLIEVSPDHWANFFLDNIPAVCFGVGEEHEGPPEPFLKDFPHRSLRGHPQLAMHLARSAFEADFEPSISHRLKLDHGFCIPLWKMGLERLPRIVPMIVNSIEPPLPSLRRCIEWGLLLKRAIETYAEPLRIGVLATGGLSHSIGERTMGDIDEPFDLECIRLLSEGTPAELAAFLEMRLPMTGNGAHEVRNWAVAHGAAGCRGFRLVDYLAVPAVIVGCTFAAWEAPRAAA